MSIEFYTNEELLDELMKRPTFQGLIFYNGGEHDNQAEGNGKIKLRASKGLPVGDLMLFLRFGVDTFRKMFSKGFAAIFSEFPVEDEDPDVEGRPELE
jgi:hypothetical protein